MVARLFIWIDRVLDRTFFHPVTTRSLCLFRLIYCVLLALTLQYYSEGFDERFTTRVYNPIPLFENAGLPLMDPDVFRLLRYVLLSSLACAAVGFLTRLSLMVAWPSYFLYMGTALGFTKSAHTNYVYHTQNICVFVLLILAFAPGISAWGVDGWLRRGRSWRPAAAELLASAWPAQLIKATLGIAYFGSCYTKMRTSVFWPNGHTLQGYMLQKHLLIDSPQSLWLAESFVLCLLLGIGTIAFEGTFFLTTFFRRLAWVFVPIGLSFHGGILFFMEINFFVYFAFTYLVFLARPPSGGLPQPERPIGKTPWSTGFVVGLSSLCLACVLLRVESWPFSDYRVFENRNHPEKVVVFRPAVVDEAGELHWPTIDELPASPVTYNWKLGTAFWQKDEEQLRGILQAIADHLEPDYRARFEALVLTRRRIRVEEDGSFRIDDKEVRRIPLGTRG
jgi:hypothetical protein